MLPSTKQVQVLPVIPLLDKILLHRNVSCTQERCKKAF